MQNDPLDDLPQSEADWQIILAFKALRDDHGLDLRIVRSADGCARISIQTAMEMPAEKPAVVPKVVPLRHRPMEGIGTAVLDGLLQDLGTLASRSAFEGMAIPRFAVDVGSPLDAIREDLRRIGGGPLFPPS